MVNNHLLTGMILQASPIKPFQQPVWVPFFIPAQPGNLFSCRIETEPTKNPSITCRDRAPARTDTPLKLNMEHKNHPIEIRKIIFQTSIFRFHVNFSGVYVVCNPWFSPFSSPLSRSGCGCGTLAWPKWG